MNTTGRSMSGLQRGNRRRRRCTSHQFCQRRASLVDSFLHDAFATAAAAAAGVHRWFYLSSDMCLIASAVHSCWVNCNEPPLKKAVVYLWLVISGVDNQGATKSVQTKLVFFCFWFFLNLEELCRRTSLDKWSSFLNCDRTV